MNETRDAAMRFGLSGSGAGFESCDPGEWPGLARWVEELGFHSLWLNEEHFQARDPQRGGRHVLSPVLTAAALAVHTQRIRLGFSVLLLPLHQPVRLAEELASLDRLSNGRVDFGVSRGGNPQYFAALAPAENATPEQGRRDFVADLNRMFECWSDRTIEAAGLQIDVHPKPVQKPHPPVFVGTYSPELAGWAAQSGHRLIVHGIQPMPHAVENLRAFTRAGGDPGCVPFGRFVYVGDSIRQARSELRGTVIQLAERLRGVARQRLGFIDEALLEPEAFMDAMAIVGDADFVAEAIAGLRDTLGIRHLNLLSAFFGYLPPDLLRASLQRFGEQVIPRMSAFPGSSRAGVL